MLSEEEGKMLLRLARESINNKAKIPGKPFLEEKRGVFVTLTIDGELRGCVGLPYPTKQLGKAVVSASKSAAYEDYRFSPLSDEEKDKIKIEVSVLSLPHQAKLEDVKKGDGVILEYYGSSALFLPQVWKELPTKESFLESLALKAGLNRQDYKKAEYKVFNVQAFEE